MKTRSEVPAIDPDAFTGKLSIPEARWRILVATDGSECAVQAQRFLARMAFPAGTQIRVVAVAADPFASAGTHGDPGFANWRINFDLCSAEQEFLGIATREAAARLSRTNWEVTRSVLIGDVCHQILAAVEEFRANLILIGTKGLTGLDRLLLGSTARKVTRHATCSVLVARRLPGAISRVVLAIDGSIHGCQAVEHLAQLPLPENAEVMVAHVSRSCPSNSEPQEVLRDSRDRSASAIEARHRRPEQQVEQMLQKACARLAATGKQAAPKLLWGVPAEEILNLAAGAHADLLVAGARGASLIPGLLVGSVADALLQNSPCSLLLVR